MKQFTTLLIAACLSLGAMPAQAQPKEGQPQVTSSAPLPGSSVLAVVNQRSITMEELNHELNRPDIKAAIDTLQEQPAELEKLRRSVLSTMVDRELLIKEAKASPSYRPDDVKKEVEGIIQEQGGQSVIQPILSSYGTSWDAFVEDMNDRLTIEKFIEKDLLTKITISDEELKAAFAANPSIYAAPETVRARHILILVTPQASKEDQAKALKRIQDIRKRAVASGADFGKIAADTTDDTASKVDGGNLGAFQRGMMVPEFEKAAFELKVGAVSEPVKTEYGYHIIKVEEHKQSEPPAFEKAKDQVRYQLMANTHDKIVSEKLAQLRAGAKIEYK